MSTVHPHPPELGPDRSPGLVRASYRVSVLSVAWTLASSSAAVVVGTTAGSTVLIALGAIGIVDAVGSTALAYHFLHHLRHQQFSERREAIAHRAVSLGLAGVGLATAVGATVRLLSGQNAEESVAGALIAGVSMVVLTALSARKRSLGGRIRSRALIGDGHLSAIGAAQAGVALAGIAIAEWLDAGWADAGAALAVGLLALVIGVSTWKAAPDDS